jgi:phage tail-like protein
MSALPAPDDYAQSQFFKVTLDGAPVKDESHFVEVTGLDVTFDMTEYMEGGTLTARKLPGPPSYSNIQLKRGVTCSKTFVEWVQKSINERNKDCRMGGKIALCKRDGTPMIEWTFQKGWCCRYEGPRMSTQGSSLAFECIEIAHEGLLMQG